jgi:ribosomal protein S18 acetylase RimI-like enzyme
MADDRTERAIEILADGFMDNPVLGWVFQDEATRADGIRGYVRVFLAAYGRRGVLDLDASGEGAALWAEPGTPRLEGEHVTALVDLLRKYNGDRTGLVLSTLGVIVPPAERHWYLNVIAARRGARSRGIGARLLEPFLTRADREGVGIYLESSNPRNLSFYRRYGFENRGDAIDLPGVGPVLQPMWRCPPSDR